MPGLFLPRSRPWLWATAAEGGLEPAPVSRFRGASPHRISSYALLGLTAFHAHGARWSANRTLLSSAWLRPRPDRTATTRTCRSPRAFSFPTCHRRQVFARLSSGHLETLVSGLFCECIGDLH